MRLGYLLLVAGTIIASLGGAKLPEVDRVLSGIGIAMLVVAAVAIRRAMGANGAAALSGSAVPAAAIPELMRKLIPELEALAAEAKDLPLVTITRRIDQLEPKYLRPLADGSPGLMGVLGPERFAEVAGAYASGERFLARAWSAAADKHRPEALLSLERAIERMREALVMLDRKG